MAWRGVAWRGVALRLRSAVIDCVLQAAEDPVRGRAHDDLLPVPRPAVRPPVVRVNRRDKTKKRGLVITPPPAS